MIAEIIGLYRDEGLSLQQVADKTGVSAMTVQRTLVRAGIPRRAPGRYARPGRAAVSLGDGIGTADPRPYVRVAAGLHDRIAGGDLKPGDRVRLDEVCAAAGVSRNTAAKAMLLLEREGLLARYPGAGYQVAQPGRDGADPRAYLRVADGLRGQISSGVLRPGDLLRQRAVSAAAGVSRETVGKANAAAGSRGAAGQVSRHRVPGEGRFARSAGKVGGDLVPARGAGPRRQSQVSKFRDGRLTGIGTISTIPLFALALARLAGNRP